MTNSAFRIYAALVSVVGAGAMILVAWNELAALSRYHLGGLAAFIVLGIAAENNALALKVGKNVGNTSITFILLFSSILVFGPVGTIAFVVATGTISEFLIRRKEMAKASFNVSQYALSVFVAADVYQRLGGAWSTEVFVFRPIAFLTFGVCLIAMNQMFVSLGIAINENLRFHRVFRQVAGEGGSNLIYDLLVSPLAVLVAYLYLNFYVWGLFFVLFLLEFVRHSYLTKLELQHAIKDLTRALVKAIETRDPYTSGHSLRVSALARKVGDALRLSQKQLEQVETAALLHDIGKIEAIYEEILMKPGELSPLERKMIESHVHKGVELLESLSSFEEQVILSVRHHHERYDGKGYPDGISGKDIPIGGRIIKICDAIDAMLSDRPYRKALELPVVRQELLVHSGTQFDPDIVERLLATDYLEQHADEVSAGSHRFKLRGPRPTQERPKVRVVK